MGLEDRFYPDDGTLLTRYDNFMIRSAGDIGDIYQECTGKSYRGLVKGSYGLSTLAFLSSAALGNLSGAYFTLISYTRFSEPKFQTALEEEIQQEAGGHFKKGQKIARILIPSLGLAIGYYGYSHFTDDPSFSISSLFDRSCILILPSTFILTFAEYLSLAHLPKPPKKTVFDTLKENISMALTIPQTVSP